MSGSSEETQLEGSEGAPSAALRRRRIQRQERGKAVPGTTPGQTLRDARQRQQPDLGCKHSNGHNAQRHSDHDPKQHKLLLLTRVDQ